MENPGVWCVTPHSLLSVVLLVNVLLALTPPLNMSQHQSMRETRVSPTSDRLNNLPILVSSRHSYWMSWTLVFLPLGNCCFLQKEACYPTPLLPVCYIHLASNLRVSLVLLCPPWSEVTESKARFAGKLVFHSHGML